MTKKNKAAGFNAELPFMSHLVELRDRLLRTVLLVLVIFICLFYFANDLFDILTSPFMKWLPENATFVSVEILSPFLAPLKLALITSIFIGMPYILYNIWAFVAPGLYKKEKKLALPLLIASIFLFYAGMAFAYFVVFPLVFSFVVSTVPGGVEMNPDISKYLDFVLKMFFAFGFAFEVPIATIVVVATGMTTPDRLAAKRSYMIVGAFVIGMLLTPPDIISQIMLALPMWILFELGIFLSRIMVRKKKEAEEKDTQTSS